MFKILKTKVADYGLTQLIQKLGRDCTPTQFVREFVMNAIEAIQRTKIAGQILVDVNWDFYKKYGLYKMCFIDTGDGMTCDEMLEHLNNLSSSGHDSNVYENYGVGAKIAALTRNHCGIIYESWKDGEGNMIVIHYDNDQKSYGVQPVEDDDGNADWCIPLADDAKPTQIKEHGTRVTLLGMEMQQDMMIPPPYVKGGRENWLYQFINTRFYKIPDEVDLQVRIGYYRDPDNKKHNYTRRIEGQSKTLEKNSESYGVVKISDARVYWWILKEERSGHGREYVLGHTGCLNQNELFDLGDGRSSKAPGFGILFGKENVVIYVEPTTGYVQNTSRTGLVQDDGSPLPWDKWQDEFRQVMPPELDAYVKARLNAAVNVSHDESIRNRLKAVASFFKISRYRKSLLGSHMADPDSEVASEVGGGANGQGSSGVRTRSGPAAGSLEEILLSSRKEKSGVLAEEVFPSKFPKLVWISSSDGTRGGDELEDRAAEYIETDNLIRANADFQGFTDIIKFFIDQFPDVEGAGEIIKNEVNEAFEQQLIETVTGALSLKNRPRWNPDDFKNSISEEALTAAVMSRYHIITYIKRQIKNKLQHVQLVVQASGD